MFQRGRGNGPMRNDLNVCCRLESQRSKWGGESRLWKWIQKELRGRCRARTRCCFEESKGQAEDLEQALCSLCLNGPDKLHSAVLPGSYPRRGDSLPPGSRQPDLTQPHLAPMAFSYSHFIWRSLTQFQFHWNWFPLTWHLGTYPLGILNLKVFQTFFSLTEPKELP